MSLDLGQLIAHATINDVQFQRTYGKLVGQMGELGKTASTAAGGTARLDESLNAAGTSGTRAAAGIDRAARSTTAAAAADDKAAAAASRHSEGVARVAAIMQTVAGETPRVQAATLRLAAAQERLNETQASGVATTRRLAAAHASLIGAERGLAAAQADAAVATSRWRSGLASLTRSAGELGLIVGTFEAIKKAIEITKQANDFQRAMVQVQTNASVTRREVDQASEALLKMAGPVAAAPDELAVAWYHAKAVGLDYAKSIETTRIAAEGARVGHADLEETMNALTSTVASGIPGVKNMSSAMGQLIAIVGTGDMKLADLNQALGSGILSVVKGYGLSLTDVGAALATFGDNNIRGADAATMLRMAVQAMAVPAKAGEGRLRSLGLETKTLAHDMQRGGLNKAIHDLKEHLDAAGVSSVQVGEILTEIFGKRAGPGLQVLIGQVDRLDSKFKVLRESGATFDEKWKATTQTASFALARLEHGAEAAGIALTAKLGPSIAKAATWLAVTVPHAIHGLVDALEPTIHMVGVGLTGAWWAVVHILGPVVSALGQVTHFLADHGVLSDFATAVLVMWAAFKGYTIAVAAFKAVQTAIVLTRVRLAEMAASGSLAAAGVAAFAIAAYAAGKAMSSWLDDDSVAIVNGLSDSVKNLRDQLEQTNGAITDSIKLSLAKQMQDDGLAAKAAKAGISLRQLTDGVTGSDAAYNKLVETWKKAGDPSDETLLRLEVQRLALKKAADETKNLATLTDHATDAAKRNATATAAQVQFQKDLKRAQGETKITIDGTTYAMRGQSTAADILNAALARLSGDKNAVAESQLALADSLAAGTQQIKDQAKQYKDSGTSLKANTAEGRKNLEWLHQQIDLVNAIASAQIKNNASTQTVTNTLAKNEKKVRDTALAMGLGKEQVDAFLDAFAAKPKDLELYIKANADQAATTALKVKRELDDLTKQRTALVKLQNGGKDVSDALWVIQRRMEVLNGSVARPKVLIEVGLNMDVGKAVHNAVNSIGPQITQSVHDVFNTITPHAGGGFLSSGWNLVGEHGIELIGPDRRVYPTPQSKAMMENRPALHAGNIAEALHGVRFVLDGGSLGMLAGYIDSRVDYKAGRAARTPAARQATADALR